MGYKIKIVIISTFFHIDIIVEPGEKKKETEEEKCGEEAGAGHRGGEGAGHPGHHGAQPEGQRGRGGDTGPGGCIIAHGYHHYNIAISRWTS